jgi:hypothetical protein
VAAFVRTLAARGGRPPPGESLSTPHAKVAVRYARRARVALRCDRLGERPRGGAARRFAATDAAARDAAARRSSRSRAAPSAYMPVPWTPRAGRTSFGGGARSDSGSDSDWSCGDGREASPARAARAARRAATRSGPTFQAVLPDVRPLPPGGPTGDEAAWVARRVLARSELDPGAAGDPSPLAMIGTGKDEGAGLTPWRYVVERTGGEPPAAAAEGLGLGSMGAPSAAAWTDAEAAAFEAALDADGRLFLLWGVGGTAIRPKKKRKGEVTDDEAEEEDKEGGERAAADGEKAAVDADGDAAMAPADGAVPSPDLPLEASPAPATADVKAEEATAAAAADPAPVDPDLPPKIVRPPHDCVNYYYNVWKTGATPRARSWYERRAAAAAAAEAAAIAAAAARAHDFARRSAVATEAQRRRRMKEMVTWAKECARAPATAGFDRWPARVKRYKRAARAVATARVAELLAEAKENKKEKGVGAGV